MERTAKGRNENCFIPDYCVVDLETTDRFPTTARIIEIAAIRIRNNEVLAEFSSLVNPLCHIPESATAVNNITDDMVKDAPALDDIIDDFIEFVGEDVIVGYNNASFDMNVIYDALVESRGKVFSNNYIDVFHAARRCLTETENLKLETICKFFSIDTSGKHRALKDCYMTKGCYDSLFDRFGEKAFQTASFDSHNKRPAYSAETIRIQELIAFIQAILADSIITQNEFDSLKRWTEDNLDLEGNYVYDQLYTLLCSVMENDGPTQKDLQDMVVRLKKIVDPVNSLEWQESFCSLAGKHICVTGDFNYGSRNQIVELIEKVDAFFDKTVKKTTDILVVGAKGSENWTTENFGNKVQKAMEYNSKGTNIAIIKEADFIPQAIKANNKDSEKDAETEVTILEQSDWTNNITDMLDSVTKELHLPEGSLCFDANKGKKGEYEGKIISYSIYIWEPDYPKTETVPECNMKIVSIVPSKVKSRPGDLDISISASQETALHSFLPPDAIVLSQNRVDYNDTIATVRIDKNSPYLTEYIKQNTLFCINNYVSKAASFGCCSLYEKCSDSKRCLHSNLLYSKACAYRGNLEKGLIFYGKNKNIE